MESLPDPLLNETHQSYRDAARLLGEALGNFEYQCGLLRSLRAVRRVAFPAAFDTFSSNAFQFIRNRPPADDSDSLPASVPNEVSSPWAWAREAGDMARQSLDEAETAIENATIIFAHTALDVLAYKCLEACAQAKPSAWERFVNARQVALDSFRGSTYAQLVREMSAKECDRLERESLPKKLERLLSLTSPQESALPIWYDEEWLVKFDQYRHQIVHPNCPSREGFDLDQVIERIEELACSLVFAVEVMCGLRLDPKAYGSGRRGPRGGPWSTK